MPQMHFLAHDADRPGGAASHPSSMTVFPQCRREAGSVRGRAQLRFGLVLVGVRAAMDDPAVPQAPDERDLVVGDERRAGGRSEEHTSELQSQSNLVCRLLLEKKKKKNTALFRRKTVVLMNSFTSALFNLPDFTVCTKVKISATKS